MTSPRGIVDLALPCHASPSRYFLRHNIIPDLQDVVTGNEAHYVSFSRRSASTAKRSKPVSGQVPSGTGTDTRGQSRHPSSLKSQLRKTPKKDELPTSENQVSKSYNEKVRPPERVPISQSETYEFISPLHETTVRRMVGYKTSKGGRNSSPRKERYSDEDRRALLTKCLELDTDLSGRSDVSSTDRKKNRKIRLSRDQLNKETISRNNERMVPELCCDDSLYRSALRPGRSIVDKNIATCGVKVKEEARSRTPVSVKTFNAVQVFGADREKSLVSDQQKSQEMIHSILLHNIRFVTHGHMSMPPPKRLQCEATPISLKTTPILTPDAYNPCGSVSPYSERSDLPKPDSSIFKLNLVKISHSPKSSDSIQFNYNHRPRTSPAVLHFNRHKAKVNFSTKCRSMSSTSPRSPPHQKKEASESVDSDSSESKVVDSDSSANTMSVPDIIVQKDPIRQMLSVDSGNVLSTGSSDVSKEKKCLNTTQYQLELTDSDDSEHDVMWNKRDAVYLTLPEWHH